MQARALGRSGFKVPVLTLGTMTFGLQCDEATSFAILDHAFEAGIDLLDTADVYPLGGDLQTVGRTEEIIGRWLAARGNRDRVLIASKCRGRMGSDRNDEGLSRHHIVRAVEASLRRLGIEAIDLYQTHYFDPETPIEETMRALDDLVRAGKVRYIGVSDTPAWKSAQANVLAELRGWTPFVALQIEYSLIERTVEGELVPMARELGLGITPWSPLRGGVLSGKYTRATAATANPDRGDRVKAFMTERNLTIIDELLRVAKERNASPASVALAWVQSRPGVTSTIIGARRLDQLDQNLAALDVRLTADDVAALDKVSEPTLDFPAPFFKMIPMFAQGGTTVNGTPSVVWPLAPKPGDQGY